jgi:hypothetical protein
MTASAWLRGALSVALLLAPAGCKQEKKEKEKVKEGDGEQPAVVEEGPSKEDVRKGIETRLPILQRHDASMDLLAIARIYSSEALLGMPPKKIEDLKDLDARIAQSVKDGDYVVIWNASPNAPGTAIVAYETKVPTKGGMVVNMTGTVSRMTQQEFKAAPKAAGN